MKNNQRLKMKLLTLTLLLVILGVFTQCMPSNRQQVGKSSSTGKAPVPAAKDAGQIINQTEVAAGMKSHEQILFTMSALTGVPVTNGNVRNVYNQVVTTLPTDNDIKVFLPPHQLAISKLAAEYCHTLVEDAALRAGVWPTYAGFTLTPGTGLSTANRELLIQEVLQRFWGGIVSEADKNHAETELHQLIDDLLVDEVTTNSQTTRNVIKGVCTTVLSSAHVTLI